MVAQAGIPSDSRGALAAGSRIGSAAHRRPVGIDTEGAARHFEEVSETDSGNPIIRVVDDDPSLLDVVARLLQVMGYEVRSFDSATELLRAGPGDAPGCVLADLRMPDLDGLELQEELARCEPPLPVIFLSGQGDIRSTVRAMRGGAVDFLTKPVSARELGAAIERALAVDREARAVLEERRRAEERAASLTPREREVWAHVIAGRLNKQIAGTLAIGERMVKEHRANLMAKLAAGSVPDLVRIAELLGVEPYSSG